MALWIDAGTLFDLPIEAQTGRLMALVYAAYVIVSALALIEFVRSVPLYLWRNPVAVIAADAAGLAWEPMFAVLAASTFAAVATHVGVGLFLLRARPTDRFALLVSLTNIVGGLGLVSGVGLDFAEPAWKLAVHGLWRLGSVLVMAVWLTLPDGRFVPRSAIALLLAFSIWHLIGIADPSVAPCLCDNPRIALYLCFFFAAAAAQVYRYRAVATKHQRDQMKWITVALIASAITLAIASAAFVVWPFAFRVAGTDAVGLLVVVGSNVLHQVANIGVALALAIAIVRTRLFAIDLIINRTLLYAAVTVVLIGVFAGLNGLAQTALELAGVGGSGLVTALLAAATAAVFAPLRKRLAPVIDRLLPARALLTLVFLDLVSSTERLAALGDERWRDVLSSYRAIVRREITRSEGREIDNAGDGFFVIFTDPLRAVSAAARIRRVVRDLGLELRIGVHVGECEMRGEKPTGLAVHAAARVMSCAQGGEIFVSADAHELLQGTGVTLVDRGLHPLRGVAGEWRLYLADPARLAQLS